MFANQKIGTKMAMGFGAILSVILVVASLSLWELGEIGGQSSRITELRTPTVQASTRMETAINEALASLRGWMLLGTERFKDDRKKAWDEIDLARQSMEELSTSWTNSKNIERLEEIKILLKDFEKFQDEIEKIAQLKENIPAVQMLFSDAAPLAAVIIAQITSMIEAEKAQSFSSKRKKLFAEMADFRGTMAIGLANIRAYLLSGESRFRIKFERAWAQNGLHYKALVKMQKIFNSGQKKAFAILVKAREEFAPLPEKMFTLRAEDDWNLANYWLKTKAAVKGERLIEIITMMVADQHRLLQQDGQTIQTEIDNFTNLLLALFAFAIFLSVAIGIYITRTITQPISQAVQFAEQVAEGNFVIAPSSSSSSFLETERLLQALRIMAKRLGEMVSTMRASEAQTKAIVETATDSIITINEKGIIGSFNQAATVVFGYSAEEVVGSNVRMLMPEPDHSRHDGYLSRHIETGEKRIIGKGREVIGRRKNGETVPLYLNIAAITVGEEKSFCGILRDLTEEKTGRDQLIQAGKLASLGTLTTGIAHELRQPLQVMRGNADMEIFSGIEKLNPESAFKTLTEVVDMCDRMNTIIDHLRGFAREGEGVSAESVDLNAVLDSSFSLLNQQFKSRGIDIDVEVADDLPSIDGNPNRLEQVIINLLSNARDVLEGRKDPKVHISMRQEGEHVVIVLTDNGPGMPKEIQSKIFDPFFTTKDTGKGTGLGLSISHGIITEHHGTISVSDNDGGGAKFTISLPVMADG